MKKINKSIIKKLPQVKLYLDDLKNIIEILKEEKFEKIEVITPTYEYTDNEIDQIPQSSSITKIRSHNPFYISFDFNDSGVSIYSETDSTLAEGVVSKIVTLLLSRKRKLFSLLTKFWFYALLLIATQILALILNIKGVINDLSYFLMIFGSLIFYFFFLFVNMGKPVKKNIFYYKGKEEVPSYWVRKKDEILTLIITNLITAIVTAIITVIVMLIFTK